MLYGESALKLLSDARIIIVGLGGVGGAALESLVRSGIRHITLVDFDVIRESNFNRQIIAVEPMLGTTKVKAAAARALAINPDCKITSMETFFHEDSAGDILSRSCDVLIDAIDSVTPKTALLRVAYSRGLRIVSSMGAAGKRNPALIRSADISETDVCPLARRIRKKLRSSGISEGIRCVYSTETVIRPMMQPAHEREHYERGRTRTPLGSVSYMVSIFGQYAAYEAIEIILKTKVSITESSSHDCK